MIVAIYVVFPKVVGLEGTFDRFDEATWYWIVVALLHAGPDLRLVRRAVPVA